MTRLAVQEVQEHFAATVARVADTGERIVVESHGKDLAVLVSLEDLALLEELEDRLDAEEADRRLNDPTDTPIPYDHARKELGVE